MRLESHGGVQHGRLQQAAFGAELIGVDRFMLEAECHVERGDIARHVAGAALRHAFAAGEQSHRRCRQGGDGAGAQEFTTIAGNKRFRTDDA
jgi:hypothetical protein